ncbi:hypothetical protein OAL24_00396 [Oenococcus sicerae]|nr:hypothetical protein OAL24_00396 [Oenococcus sicerae]
MHIYTKKIDKYSLLTFEIKQMNLPFTGQVVVAHDDELTRSLLLKKALAIEKWLMDVDQRFSSFRSDSELSLYNAGKLDFEQTSPIFKQIFALTVFAEEQTQGLFSANYRGQYDPTGLVKGWAIEKAQQIQLKPLLSDPNFIAINLNGGGDMQFATRLDSDWNWSIGISDPFDNEKILSKIVMKNAAIATSGTSQRGDHLIDPASGQAVLKQKNSIISTSVLCPSLTLADIWATAIAIPAINDHDWLDHIPGSGLRISYSKTAERWLDHKLVDQKELRYA